MVMGIVIETVRICKDQVGNRTAIGIFHQMGSITQGIILGGKVVVFTFMLLSSSVPACVTCSRQVFLYLRALNGNFASKLHLLCLDALLFVFLVLLFEKLWLFHNVFDYSIIILLLQYTSHGPFLYKRPLHCYIDVEPT